MELSYMTTDDICCTGQMQAQIFGLSQHDGFLVSSNNSHGLMS